MGKIKLSASDLYTGTIGSARFPSTLPAVSGENLTALNASNLSTGTVSASLLPLGTDSTRGALIVGSNITLTTGTISLTSSNVTNALGYTPVRTSVASTFTAAQVFGETTLTDQATIAWDVSANQVAKVTLGASRIMDAPTNMVNGGFYSLMVIQDGSGNKTLSWNGVFKWASGSAPTLSTAANAKDLIVFRSDGTNMYQVGITLGLA